MPDPFQTIRDIIAGRQEMPPDLSCFKESCYRRLLRAMRDVENRAAVRVGPGDLSALVRHVLRFEGEQQQDVTQTLRVPKRTLWPVSEDWRKAAMDVVSENTEFYTVRANTWHPDWLLLSDEHPPAADAFAHRQRREYDSVAGDPFLSPMGFDSYSCAGQRDAMRAVLTTPPGATLVVNLPTGSGKSLCMHLPALLRSKNRGVMVVVVPTTALCIDQEKSLEGFIGHPTAYYGGSLAPGMEERNRGIRERIQSGLQRVVFTSPESLLKSLCRPVYDAVKQGFLKMMVIDEAHITDLWGDEFRSSFQEIAGMRKDLLRICTGHRFQTLLLSATITSHSLSTLEVLFGQPGPFKMISSVLLRPEPSYWFSYCQTEYEKQARVMEVVSCLPRPLILYTTQVKEAKAWARKLRNMGNKRCGLMTGHTPGDERFALIRQWRNEELDLMVATSAFGLGVDQADVRSVVHACVPESIDRFYQEVGRGGRDGQASISLSISTREDLRVARGLRNRKLITIEKGLDRWDRMFGRKEAIEGRSGSYRVRIDLAPPYDIDMQSDENTAWNVRTLTLMDRAGLIEMDGEAPPTLEIESENGEDSLDDELYEAYRNSRVVKIRNEDHLSMETWERDVEPVRQATRKHTYRSISLMVQALKGQRCMSEIFREIYSIDRTDFPVLPTLACGGCQVCFRDGTNYNPVGPLRRLPLWDGGRIIEGELTELFLDGNFLAIFYSSEHLMRGWQTESRIERIIHWLVGRGIQNLVIPVEVRSSFSSVFSAISDEEVFLFDDFNRLYMPKLPTLVLVPENTPIPPRCLPQTRPEQGNHKDVLILPDNARDPQAEHRFLADILQIPIYDVDEICTRVGL
jgi:ATP-dependent DNA helicase RecQ